MNFFKLHWDKFNSNSNFRDCDIAEKYKAVDYSDDEATSEDCNDRTTKDITTGSSSPAKSGSLEERNDLKKSGSKGGGGSGDPNAGSYSDTDSVRGRPTGNDKNNNSNDSTTTDSATRFSNHGKANGSRSGNSGDLKRNGNNGEGGTGGFDPVPNL